MTDKWQCSKCKKLSVIDVETDGTIDQSKIEQIKCCCRLMRNLSEIVYEKELSIYKSGARK